MRFKDIHNFKGLYQVSDTGIVKALEKKVPMPNGGTKTIKEHFPKLSKTNKGYLKVMLTNSDGKRKGFFVHRLVLSAFLRQDEMQCNHIDENKENNNISNLEYVTNRKNQIHSIDKSKTHSKYTGVTKTKSGRWQAQKMINGKNKYLGVFDTEIEAHEKYKNS